MGDSPDCNGLAIRYPLPGERAASVAMVPTSNTPISPSHQAEAGPVQAIARYGSEGAEG